VTTTVGPPAVALRFIDHLVSHTGLKPGDKLPTERELAAQAGVSRAVIRSVLDDLEARGVLLRQVGRGTFLTPSHATATDGPDHPSPGEIMSVGVCAQGLWMNCAKCARMAVRCHGRGVDGPRDQPSTVTRPNAVRPIGCWGKIRKD